MKRTTFFIAAAAVTTVMGTAAIASDLQLNSLSSQANIKYGVGTTTLDGANRSGNYFLYRDGGVDKIQDLVQQTFFYQIGAGPIQEVNALNSTMTGMVGTSQGSVVYGTAADPIQIGVTYNLQGSGASGFANTLKKTIAVKNNGTGPLSMKLWSYNDYTLTGISPAFPTPGAAYADNNNDPAHPINNGFEYAKMTASNQITQWDNYAGGDKITNMVTTYGGASTPTQLALGNGGGTSNATGLLANLVGGTIAGNYAAVNQQIGGQDGGGMATDVAFAAEWDLVIGGGGTVRYLYETTQITPEPASVALIAIGAGVMMIRRRKA